MRFGSEHEYGRDCIYESEVRHVGDIVDGFHRKRAAMDTETLQVEAFGNEDTAPSNVHKSIAYKKRSVMVSVTVIFDFSAF